MDTGTWLTYEPDLVIAGEKDLALLEQIEAADRPADEPRQEVSVDPPPRNRAERRAAKYGGARPINYERMPWQRRRRDGR